MLGLGESSALIAKGLSNQGMKVVAFDPEKRKNPAVKLMDSAVEAVLDADVVFSLNSTATSLNVAQQVASWLKPGAIFCDLNAGTPGLKKRIAEILPAGSFVDVAVMKAVDDLAEKVPLSVSGPGAERFMEIFAQLDMDLTYVSEVPGEAAAQRLILKIVREGLASLIIDALWAAKELGLEDWALDEIKREVQNSNGATVHGHLDDTAKNAKRQSVELADLVEMLSEANYESTMLNGIAATLSKVMHSKKIPFANPED